MKRAKKGSAPKKATKNKKASKKALKKIKKKARDDFPPSVVALLQKRAAFICSNPHCRKPTLKAGDQPHDIVMTGIAAHICAASEKGPRFDSNQTVDERKSIDNGIFLCATCAAMIDKNKGVDFPAQLLRKWRQDHEEWVRGNFNRTADPQSNVSKLAAHYVVMQPLIQDFRFRIQCLFEGAHRSGQLHYQRMTNLFGPGEKITDEYHRNNALSYFFESQERLQVEISNLLKNIDLEDWPTIKDGCVLFINACQLRKGGDAALIYGRARSADGSSASERHIEQYIKNSEGEPQFTSNAIQNAYISVWKQLVLQSNAIHDIESAIAVITEN